MIRFCADGWNAYLVLADGRKVLLPRVAGELTDLICGMVKPDTLPGGGYPLEGADDMERLGALLDAELERKQAECLAKIRRYRQLREGLGDMLPLLVEYSESKADEDALARN